MTMSAHLFNPNIFLSEMSSAFDLTWLGLIIEANTMNPDQTATFGANTMNPDQTAPFGAVWSGSILFALMLPKND